MHYHVVVKENVKFFLDRLDSHERKRLDLAIVNIRATPFEMSKALGGLYSGLGYYQKVVDKTRIFYTLLQDRIIVGLICQKGKGNLGDKARERLLAQLEKIQYTQKNYYYMD